MDRSFLFNTKLRHFCVSHLYELPIYLPFLPIGGLKRSPRQHRAGESVCSVKKILEAVLILLRNNIIVASRYVPAILSPCLGINLKQLLKKESHSLNGTLSIHYIYFTKETFVRNQLAALSFAPQQPVLRLHASFSPLLSVLQSSRVYRVW